MTAPDAVGLPAQCPGFDFEPMPGFGAVVQPHLGPCTSAVTTTFDATVMIDVAPADPRWCPYGRFCQDPASATSATFRCAGCGTPVRLFDHEASGEVKDCTCRA